MPDRLVTVLLVVVSGIPVGLLGAGAFNPDDGWLARSEPLWRVFGIYAYVGMLLTVPVAVALAVSLAVRRRSG